MDLAYNRNAQIRRRLLEDFPEAQAISPAKPFVNHRSLRSASFHSPEYVLTQLEILEHEGRVVLKRLPADPAECMVNLTPLGWKSLEVAEDVWLRSTSANQPATNTTKIEFHNSTVGNVAQVVGSHGTTINQTQGAPDLQSVTAAIDRLVEIIKNHPTLTPEAKNDAEIEADQLKGELKKSKPNTTFITKILESFKALDTAATVLPHVMDLVDKLKAYLPGVF
jgi:hypothetical protein